MPPNDFLGLFSIKNTLGDRIACGPTKNPIKHSKRRRRRRRRVGIINVEENSIPPTAAAANMENPALIRTTTTTTTTTVTPAASTAAVHHFSLAERKQTNFTLSLHNYLQWQWRRKSQQSTFLLALLIPLFMTTTTLALSENLPCDSNSWWDSVKDKCIECTICENGMIPLRPCQLHRDTVCGSIYDLKIDWVVLSKTEPNWKERRKSDGTAYGLSALSGEHHQQLTQEELQQFHDDNLPMDWQTAALFVAVFACLIFFIVAACILIHHMRQWRRMERRLDQDVEELSTKLMAKLAEVQNLDGGTFFIGNAEALQVPTRFQPQHVLLPADKSLKHQPHSHHHQHPHHQLQTEHHFLKTTQPGNVYIENASKG